ncbi:MAG: hypothetical protein WAN50_00905 [Minisyncoccia bacterium]
MEVLSMPRFLTAVFAALLMCGFGTPALADTKAQSNDSTTAQNPDIRTVVVWYKNRTDEDVYFDLGTYQGIRIVHMFDPGSSGYIPVFFIGRQTTVVIPIDEHPVDDYNEDKWRKAGILTVTNRKAKFQWNGNASGDIHH